MTTSRYPLVPPRARRQRRQRLRQGRRAARQPERTPGLGTCGAGPPRAAPGPHAATADGPGAPGHPGRARPARRAGGHLPQHRTREPAGLRAQAAAPAGDRGRAEPPRRAGHRTDGNALPAGRSPGAPGWPRRVVLPRAQPHGGRADRAHGHQRLAGLRPGRHRPAAAKPGAQAARRPRLLERGRAARAGDVRSAGRAQPGFAPARHPVGLRRPAQPGRHGLDVGLGGRSGGFCAAALRGQTRRRSAGGAPTAGGAAGLRPSLSTTGPEPPTKKASVTRGPLSDHSPASQAATASAATTGWRIRWSNALSAPLAPSPAAITICLYGTVVQSPAANTPGTLVWPLASTTISPKRLSSTVPLRNSVLGTRPICTNTPSSGTRCSSPVARSLYFRPLTLPSAPVISVVCAFTWIVTLGRLFSLLTSTASALSWSANSTRVTCSTMPARSMAASTPELPPPMTAVRLPLNSGPSQCGQ